MRHALIIIPMLLAPAVCGDEAPPQGVCTAAQVVRVVDGDTIDVEIKYRVRVRLLDCWAPEIHTTDPEARKRGIESKKALEDLCQDKACILHVPTQTARNLSDLLTFGRVLGHVWIEGMPKESISEWQVRTGHATRYQWGP